MIGSENFSRNNFHIGVRAGGVNTFSPYFSLLFNTSASVKPVYSNFELIDSIYLWFYFLLSFLAGYAKRAITSSSESNDCSPVVMFFRAILPAAISVSPTRATYWAPIESA